jgi:predicted dehydrogenase
MAGNFTRREFLRTSAVGATAVALGQPGVARGYPANEKARVGWIGIGGRGSQLLTDFVAQVDQGHTAAVCDLIPERIDRGKQIAAKDKPNGYADFRKMIETEKLDGVLVATQPNAHAEVVVPVLEMRTHCFAEKPMDTTVERIDAIVVAARKAWKEHRVMYQIGTQRRYHPGYLKCMEAIRDGMIGDVTYMQGCWHWPGMVSGIPVERDGGRLTEQACHHMDVSAWVMNEQHPIRCVAMAKSQGEREGGPNKFGETHSSTTWEFPGNVLFSYTHLFYLPQHYTEEKFIVFGKGGAIDLVHGMFYKYVPPPSGKPPHKGERIAIDSGSNWNLGAVESLKSFVAQIKAGPKKLPSANVETGRVATLMCRMGRKAAVNAEKNVYEPRVMTWEAIGSKTELSA